MAEYLTNDTDLKKVADAIRTKGKTNAALAYPDEYVFAIEAITTGTELKIVVSVATGSTVTATKGELTVSGVSINGSCTLIVPEEGTWSVKATRNGKLSNTVAVTVTSSYDTTLSFIPIYGVSWDGSSTSKWTRTDDAAEFAEPVAAISNGDGSSPFDMLMPWSGMQIVDDTECGKLVVIPKYYYKWTKIGTAMTLQISPEPQEGFSVSPAHADRGDGMGERDVVYVGRYHCTDNYKSSNDTPLTRITRAAARTNIHNLGNKVWQYDFAMYWTIRMLYLVEYADWNTQNTIGRGCGNSTGTQKQGATDAMIYHTGTSEANRTTFGVGIQYRYIEGLWSNVYDWCDGIYCSGTDVYAIKTPTLFSDTTNGTKIADRLASTGYISALSIPDASGLEYALWPSALGGSKDTYICDYYKYGVTGVCLRTGSGFYRDYYYGMFYIATEDPAGAYSGITGCRVQKLP